MATCRKRGSTWRFEVVRKGKRVSKTFPTKAQGEAWAREIETDILAGAAGNRAKKTLADALARYARDVSPAKGGEKWEVLRLDKFGRDMDFVGELIGDITPDHIGQWRDQRLKAVQAGSVLRELNLLSAVFEAARREWRWTTVNPVRDVRRPRQPAHRERLIDDAERDLIVAQLGWQGGAPTRPGHEVAIAFLLALETAMRAGEIIGLERQRLYLKQRYLRLEKTKNGTARDVPLSIRAVELLDLLPDQLFSITGVSLDVLFRKARDAAKVHGITFHDTRHTAITRLARKLDVLDLARMTGHRNPKSLMTYYNARASDIAQRLG